MNERLREVEIMARLRVDLVSDRHTREMLLASLDGMLKLKLEQAEALRVGLHNDMCHVGIMPYETDMIN